MNKTPYENDRPLLFLVIAAMLIAAAFMLTSCEREHNGDTYIISADDGAQVDIDKDNETQNANNDTGKRGRDD